MIRVLLLLLLVCSMTIAKAQFEIHGHRGCRGLMPENTIAAFIEAVKLGVTAIELDVVMTSDGKVLVSHEPYMSNEICLQPDGSLIKKNNEKKFNIYEMDFATVRQYDCGSKGNSNFVSQKKFKTHKPLLSEVIDEVEKFTLENKLPSVVYNIEIKSAKRGDNKFHPEPEKFSNLVMDVVNEKKITGRTIIQSFDVRILQFLHQQKVHVKLGLLVANIKSPSKNISILGFNPDYYNPYYKLISAKRISKLKLLSIKVVPWTVNSEADMRKLISAGVNGIITDYPDKLAKLMNSLQQ